MITTEELNELAKRAYDNACKHGFHDKEHSDKHYLMLIVCEIAEAVEADREGRWLSAESKDCFDCDIMDDAPFEVTYKEYIKGSVEEKLAEIAIRLCYTNSLQVYSFSPSDYKVSDDMTFTEDCYFLCETATEAYGSSHSKLNKCMAVLQSICAKYHVDLHQHMLWKMRYNESKPIKHGKKFKNNE